MYGFRVQVRLGPAKRVMAKSPRLELDHLSAPTRPVWLESATEGAPIDEARELTLRGTGYADPKTATAAAEAASDKVTFALTVAGIGAVLAAPEVSEVRQVDLRLRVTITTSGVVGVPGDRITSALPDRAAPFELDPQARLACALFAASDWASEPSAKFVNLVIALEALAQPSARSAAAVAVVEQAICSAQGSTGIDEAERDSLLGSLRQLRKASISRTVQGLARPSDLTTAGGSMQQFLKRTYQLRSDLVHGTRIPTDEELVPLLADLRAFVQLSLRRAATETRPTALGSR
jgi:hypothetical protein